MTLPKTVIKQIDTARKQCLWRGAEANAKKIAKAAWPMVCVSKGEGGLGVHNLQTQNEALLLKHLHKFFNRNDLPWVKLIWDKHYRNDKLPNPVVPKGSFWWRDVLKLLDKYKGLASVLVSDGKSCLLWEDLWNGQVRKLQFPELHSYAKNKWISASKAHATDALFDLFNLPVLVEAFKQLQELEAEFSAMALTSSNDSWTYIWGSPHFSSSKAYSMLAGHTQADPIYKKLWKTSCQGKHKVFFWLVLKDMLTIRNMLRRRRMPPEDYSCVLCQQQNEETLMHMLLYYPFAKSCWGTLNFAYADNMSIMQIFEAWRALVNAPFALDIFILACWSIWQMRNHISFRNRNVSVEDWKRNLTAEALMLLHRTKRRITPLLESWIQSHF